MKRRLRGADEKPNWRKPLKTKTKAKTKTGDDMASGESKSVPAEAVYSNGLDSTDAKVPFDKQPNLQSNLTVVRPTDPMSILQTAVEKGANVEQLERLTALVERWQDRQAQQAFAEAINKFQSLCPTVFKSRQTKEAATSSFQYRYASFDDIMSQAAPALAECGISIGFNTEHNLEKNILTVICRVRVGSYFEDRTFACPTASTLKVSDAQKFGSALSYAKRYCLCAALNIVTTDHDDDGQSGSFEYIEPEQVEILKDLIDETNSDLARFLAWAQVDSLDKIIKSEYPKVKDMLVRKQRTVPQ